MAPIQIARIYRLTQELTPAGTIISLNMTTSIYVGTCIAMVFKQSFGNIYEEWLRLISAGMNVIALCFLFKRARAEW